MSQDSNLKTENYIRDVLFIFFAQRNLILGTTAVIFAAALVVATFWPRTYGAYGSVLLRGKDAQKSPQALERIDVRSYPVTKEDLFSEVEMLESPDVIELALQKLKEVDDPAAKIPIEKIRASLKANIVPASHIIQLSIKGDNPDRLVSLIDAILDVYIIYRTQVHNPREAVDFYSQQADNFKADLEGVEAELMALVELTDTPDPMAEITKNIMLKENFEQQLHSMRTDAINLRESVAYIDQVLERDEANLYAFITNTTIHQMAWKLVDLHIERGKVARNYQPDSKAVVRIDQQLEQSHRMIRLEVVNFQKEQASRLSALEENIASMEELLAKIDADNVALKRQELRQENLQHQALLLRDSYQTFVRRREEARMNSGVGESYSSFFVRVLATGYPSNGALFPRPKILIPLGLIAGLITGFALGFLREYFDHTFKNPRDVEHFGGLPLLFSLPVLKPQSIAREVGEDDQASPEDLPNDPRLINSKQG